MSDQKPEPDDNQIARILVAASTGSEPTTADELECDPETRKIYEKLKAEELERQKRE